MARTRQVPQKRVRLSQTISGYKGYSSTSAARRTDQAFSEEVLERLSETVATVSRVKRSGAGNVSPDVLPNLDVVTDSADRLAKYIADTIPTDEAVLDTLENGRVEELIGLDAVILEKIGNINQALSMMDLEGGVGITPDDLDSICELLDDVGNYLRERSILISG